jgi:hypothetical protein
VTVPTDWLFLVVLVLALLGLWTPIAVALLIFREWERGRIDDESPKAASMARHPAGKGRVVALPNYSDEWECALCSSQYFVAVEQAVTSDRRE